MFYIRLKTRQEILEIIKNYSKLLYIICSGCNDINFSIEEATKFLNDHKDIYDIKVKILDYLCNKDFVYKYVNHLKDEIEKTQAVIVFSCGVGVSTINSVLKTRTILTISDTFYINGYKGFNVPYEGKFNCELCGICYLNYTAGICSIANCAKSLLNGPCGGAKNGKCEVDKTRDCIWEKIFFRLKKFGKLKESVDKVLIRKNYSELKL